MADLDLQTKNLCTTEDAFENFQAVAMYEEDEYITLSDIISPPHTNPDHDVSEILHGVHIDEVPMSIQEDKPENNIKVTLELNKVTNAALETDKQQDTMQEIPTKRTGGKTKVNVEKSNIQPIQCQSDFIETKSKRRSRKSAKTHDTNSDFIYFENSSEELEDPSDISEKVPTNNVKRKSHSCSEKEPLKKTSNKGKQGKKPKHIKQNEKLKKDKNGGICNTTSLTKDIGTKISLIALKNEQKKGRKQYRLNNQKLTSKNVTSEQCEDNSSMKDCNQSDSFTSNMPEECEKNNSERETMVDNQFTHTDKNYQTEEDLEEIPLSNLSKNSENGIVPLKTIVETNNSMHMDPDSKITPAIVAPGKKRGRPRKVLNRTPTKMLLETRKLSDDTSSKSNKNSANLQEKQNNFGSSEVIENLDNESLHNNDTDLKEITTDDDNMNMTTSTEGSKSKQILRENQSSDYQDNIMDKDQTEDSLIEKINEDNEQPLEDLSRRSVRRRVLPTWNYDESSDEDPFANMESSDDEPRRRKKGGKYYSDDEYFPGDKRQLTETESDIAMDDDELNLGESRKQKKKRNRKTDTLSKSPRKKGRKSDADSTCPTDRTTTNTDSVDVYFEDCLNGSVIQCSDDHVLTPKSRKNDKSQDKANEFENFIAKIVQGTDIKISKKSIDDVKTPLQIPVLDANDVHRSIEKSSQTKTITTRSESVQTDTLYEIPMKDQVPLTPEQSEKACEFLSGIVQTTAELGQLMTQKSNDFINKKINTKHVTDTLKMDYCVKKSFLLFKLAKHNLAQMEEDLSNQYEVFLRENNLIQHREEPTIIASTSKASDSDCEIVEEPVATKVPPKAVFNPKTVFLNKELSIKIAKKPSEEPQPQKKLNIRGSHSVWINDSVVVKKIKTNQSFLAQDSRNKKPPDCKITLEMVNNFFRNYERQKALLLCAPYIRNEWFGREKRYLCNYFVDSTLDFPEKTVVIQNENVASEMDLIKKDVSNPLSVSSKYLADHTYLSPETLMSLCTKVLQNCLHPKQVYNCKRLVCRQNDLNPHDNVKILAGNIKINNLDGIVLVNDINRNVLYLRNKDLESTCVQSLKALCFKRVVKLMSNVNYTQSKHQPASIRPYENDSLFNIDKKLHIDKEVRSLLTLCVQKVQEIQKGYYSRNINDKPESLKFITLSVVQLLINKKRKIIDRPSEKTIKINISALFYESLNDTLERNYYKVKTLLQLCLEVIVENMTNNCNNLEFLSESSKQIMEVNNKEKNCEVKSLLQLCKESLDKSCCNAKTGPTSSKENEYFKLEKNDYKVKTLSLLSIECFFDSFKGNGDLKIENKYDEVKTLFQFCKENLDINLENNHDMTKSLHTSYKQNDKLNLEKDYEVNKFTVKTLFQLCKEILDIRLEKISNLSKNGLIISKKNIDQELETRHGESKILNTLCKESTSTLLENKTVDEEIQVNPVISMQSVYDDIIESGTELPEDDVYKRQPYETNLNITIDNVNTVSEDIFSKATSDDELGGEDDLYDENYTELTHTIEDDQTSTDINYDDTEERGNNWDSQVKMELHSCLDSTSYNQKENQDQNAILAKIKIEPINDVSENIDSSNVKTELIYDQEDMYRGDNFSTFNIIPKLETTVEPEVAKETMCHKSSYDDNAFLKSNKMMVNLNSNDNASNEIFSQSSQRIRRQHEPDSDNEIDALTDSLNLLMPQNVDKSKDRLLESSSEVEENEEDSKEHERKKTEKRKRRFKKSSPSKTKTIIKDDVVAITKRMRDRIRQEQNRNETSDSEPDDLDLNLKINKERTKEKCPESENERHEEKEIQCNDVDSTELITENKCSEVQDHSGKDEDPSEENCEDFADDRSVSPLIGFDQPSELLESESLRLAFQEDNEVTQKDAKDTLPSSETSKITPYIERHECKCYPIDRTDVKIYQETYVLLDKLPESFVNTYFQYQDLTDKTLEDLDVDRLTNLQRLQTTRKTGNIDGVDRGPKTNVIGTKLKNRLVKVSNLSEVGESIKSNIKEESYNELIPSDDETETLPKQVCLVPERSVENNFAKNLLMGDDSDTEQAGDETKEVEVKMKTEEQKYKTRSGRTVKCVIEKEELFKNDELILTADKMMNKELALLHAPVVLKDEDTEYKDVKEKSHHSKTQKKPSKGEITHYRIKTTDDSSSEEEKQWFTTKEKLLKRLSKKNEDTDIDDAKRAKIVNEFIEKRGELPETRQRPRTKKRNNKNIIIKKRKQIKLLLTREIFGVDLINTKKYSQASTSKGRRNIRKVIDKKSLARSTVVANMAEFERKRRLTIRLAQLREVLGCEEDVNVVVINDELCLEYDFEEKRPIVSVHPYFTKVMKAHQYEGVKFMWDACFETVSSTSEGGEGGGCILAHCMGLGKTLQVLALLHTVLTQPQLGMRRVLVCCPLSTVLNWVDEIHKWIGPVTNQIKVFELSKLKKTYERAYQLEDWYSGGGIFIIGYELFRSLSTLDPIIDGIRPTVLKKIRTALLDPGPDIIVCDEGHLLKNDCSILAIAMSRVVTKRRIVLTGTPMQNNLREYYCMVNFVKPSLLGSYSEYSNRFENPIMNGQHRDSSEEDIKLMKARTHILHKVLEGCLQRQEASVLYPYLPKKFEYTVFISLTKCQWELYKYYLTHYAKESKQSVLKDFHALQKIWTHPQVANIFLRKTRGDEKGTKLKVEKMEKLDDDVEESPEHVAAAAELWANTQHTHELNELNSSNKFLVVFRLLQECVELGDKVLIFSTSLYTMDSLEFFLRRDNKWSLGRDYFRLDGSVPAEVRQKWCREFNSPDNTHTKLFLISTRAGSLGLNMTSANRVIIMDTSWNPAHDIQSIFRVYRFGQKKDCYIYRLVAMGTMEQKIYERSVTKQAVSCRVVDEQQIDRHYNMAELSELYRLDEDGSGVCAGLAAGVRDAALLRVAALGGEALHAVHEHDSLLRGSSETVLPEHERNAAWMQFQQEHATTHIQNIEINLPKKKEKDSKTSSIIEEVKKEDCETTVDDNGVNRKTYKNKTKNKNQEPQPTTSQRELDLEELMIEKIMTILIENEVTKENHEEISELVKNIRAAIANARKSGPQNVDPLIASIARVVLEGEKKSAQNDNIHNDNVQTDHHTDGTDDHDSDDEIITNLLQRKKRKNRIDSDEEYLPEPKKCKSYTRMKKISDPVNKATNSDSSVTSEVTEKTSDIDQDISSKDSYITPNSKETEKLHEKSETITEDSDVTQLFIQVEDSTPTDEENSEQNKLNTQVDKQKEINNEIYDNDSSNDCIEVDDNSDFVSIADEVTSEAIADEEPITNKESIKEPSANQAIITSKKQVTSEKPKVTNKVMKHTTKRKDPITSVQSNENKTQRLINEEPVPSKEPIILKKLETYQAPNKNKQINKVSVTKAETKTNKNPMKAIKSPIIIKRDSIIFNKVPTKLNNEIITNKESTTESILLSDDDEEGVITESETHEQTQETQNEETQEKPDETEKSEMTSKEKHDNSIPLHECVLTNKKFIQLVAHTYLTGNPMLDEDAATLAAQYSTLKALKEVQATGNSLTSGPIYEIALKVLGKDLIKRLHNAKINDRKDSIEDVLINTHLKCTAYDKEQKTKDMVKNQKLSKSNTVNQINTNEFVVDVEKESPIDKEVFTTNVVPVGIFKGPAAVSNQMKFVEESILPDDDEVILSSSPISSPKPFSRQNSKQMDDRAMSTDETGTSGQELNTSSVGSRIFMPQIEQTNTMSTIEGGQNKNDPKPRKNFTKAQDPKAEVEYNLNNKTSTQVTGETICLDSDDDEPLSNDNKTQDKIHLKCSDSRTLIISPLNTKPTTNKDNTNNIVLVPFSINKTPSSSAVSTSISNRNPQNPTNKTASSVDQKQANAIINNLSTVINSKCQPGDIIRINELGKVELLKRINNVATPPSTKNTNMTTSNTKKKAKINAAPSINTENSGKVNKTPLKESTAEIKPSSSVEDETDPLLVIRNAVLIPAVTNEKLMQTSEQIRNYMKCSAPEEATEKPTHKLQPKSKTQDNQTVTKKQHPDKLESTNKSKTSCKTNTVQATKLTKINVTKEVIDLTNVNYYQNAKKKMNTKINEIAVAGSSKATVSKKTTTNMNIKPNQATPISTTAAKGVPSSNSSKRSSTTIESISKKLKTDGFKRMTLNDFNLDDIDDIIELE